MRKSESTDRDWLIAYRRRLARKLDYCRRVLRRDPLVVFADDLVPAQRLAGRIDVLRNRLGLPAPQHGTQSLIPVAA